MYVFDAGSYIGFLVRIIPTRIKSTHTVSKGTFNLVPILRRQVNQGLLYADCESMVISFIASFGFYGIAKNFHGRKFL